jgi:SH3 domain protein
MKSCKDSQYEINQLSHKFVNIAHLPSLNLETTANGVNNERLSKPNGLKTFVDTKTPNKKQHRRAIQSGLICLLLMMTQHAMAANKYVTDEFEVTMRSGTSTSNSIVLLLKSGDKVSVLEEDLASQYSLVETEEGKKGYVLSRFLNELPSAKERLSEAQQENQQQSQSISTLRNEISQLRADYEDEQADNESLKSTLLASESELGRVRSASEDTLNILEDNERLNSIVETLREEKQTLADENERLKDSTGIDWFVRGAAVSLVAFLLGIIITRIRWRKQDTWGSY